MAKILIVYSTTDGQTKKICEYIKTSFETTEQQVMLKAVTQVLASELAACDKIILGASIRYGKHSESVYQFIRQYAKLLESKPNAFFSVNLVARKTGKNTPQTNPYLKKFLSQISWQPRQSAVFAGKINYPIYSFWDKQIIRLIMWITHGPTHPDAVIEFTDWAQVDRFAEQFVQQ